jgi:hypothetical protein
MIRTSTAPELERAPSDAVRDRSGSKSGSDESQNRNRNGG